MKTYKHILGILLLVGLMIQSCKKEEELGEDPYGVGKQQLGIVMSQTAPAVPAEGIVGTTVTVKATGLMPYKDKLTFMFNGEAAEVLSVSETEIKVKVPESGSTGITSIAIGDQLVLGPQFTVTGIVKTDITWRSTAGANDFVNQFYEMNDGRALVLGAFTNYNYNGYITPNNRIVRVSIDGDYDKTFRTGRGANGVLANVTQIGGRTIIVGGFSGYNQRTENISNITSLFPDGSIDTIKIQTKKKPTLTDTVTQKWFPKFNGGTNSFIRRVYPHQGKILATGDFRYYVKRAYDKDNYDFSRDTVIIDSTEIRQILRFNLDGSLDKTYRFNTGTNKGNVSANGPMDTYMHTDAANLEKLMVFGNFNTFDGQAAVRILRLGVNGAIDATFNPGSGADNAIYSLTYNATTRKYFITGIFTRYNGKAVNGMALINEDGSLDESFSGKSLSGGFATFGRQISNGMIVVSGGFKKYNNITRNGFMILNANGTLAAGYNSTGPFSGSLNDVIETKSADNKKALLLIGSFYRFDDKPVNNIIRITIE